CERDPVRLGAETPHVLTASTSVQTGRSTQSVQMETGGNRPEAAAHFSPMLVELRQDVTRACHKLFIGGIPFPRHSCCGSFLRRLRLLIRLCPCSVSPSSRIGCPRPRWVVIPLELAPRDRQQERIAGKSAAHPQQSTLGAAKRWRLRYKKCGL